jgi:soluble lytic murein transglycosylase-like protein
VQQGTRLSGKWSSRLIVAALSAALAAAGSQPGWAEQDADTARFVDRYPVSDRSFEAAQAPSADPAPAPSATADRPDTAAAPAPRLAALPDHGDGPTYYRALAAKEAAQQGLAPEIAEAVMAVESGFNPGAIGGAGEIGLMQILPSTARMLGFVGSTSDLAVPETNVHFGVTYLAQAWRLAGGDLCTAVMKYRAGHGETRFSYLSVNYCLAVRAKLFARGFAVTGTVPVATFGEPGPPGLGLGRGCGRKCLGGGRIGTVDIAALNTRLSTLVAQVRGGR